jgi:hypothetical protein
MHSDSYESDVLGFNEIEFIVNDLRDPFAVSVEHETI